jgi:hypothetical protein
VLTTGINNDGEEPMYVVIRKFRNMRDIPEAARRSIDELGPMLQQVPGFRAYHVFSNGVGGGSVGLFESREAAEAANEKALLWIKDNLADFSGSELPEVTMAEVLGSLTA